MTKLTDSFSTQELLWNAINAYAQACGGDPSNAVYGNTPRQNAVAAVYECLNRLASETQAETERLRALVSQDASLAQDEIDQLKKGLAEPTYSPAKVRELVEAAERMVSRCVGYIRDDSPEGRLLRALQTAAQAVREGE